MEQHIIQCHIVSSILKANTPPQHTHARTHIRTMNAASRRSSAQRMYTFKACIYACNNLHLRYSDNHLQNVANNNERGANERGREWSHKYGSIAQFLSIHPFSLSSSQMSWCDWAHLSLSLMEVKKRSLNFRSLVSSETNASNVQQCVPNTDGRVCVLAGPFACLLPCWLCVSLIVKSYLYWLPKVTPCLALVSAAALNTSRYCSGINILLLFHKLDDTLLHVPVCSWVREWVPLIFPILHCSDDVLCIIENMIISSCM